MIAAYVGIGSNQGDARAHVLAAFDELAQLPDTHLAARSSLYRSAPVDAPGQPDYVNAVAALYGERGTGQLLVLSQVILSLQLSFAVVPLVLFTSDKAKMGRFVNPRWLSLLAWVVTAAIVGLNAYLLLQTFTGWFGG